MSWASLSLDEYFQYMQSKSEQSKHISGTVLTSSLFSTQVSVAQLDVDVSAFTCV